MNENKLIIALDVPTADQARSIFGELRETGCAFKIGMQLFTATGNQFVREMVEADAKIFLDLKFHDIPKTVASAGVAAARLGVWMFNVHALGGREMMQQTVEAVRETVARERLASPKIIAVTILTSSNQTTLSEIGIENQIDQQVAKLAKLTFASGLDGVVASAQEAKMIKAEREKWRAESQKEVENGESKAETEINKSNDFLIVTPGIRSSSTLNSPFSTQKDDQKRVLSANEAILAGSDYLVVGRPILGANDRVKAVRDFLHEIQTALQTKPSN